MKRHLRASAGLPFAFSVLGFTFSVLAAHPAAAATAPGCYGDCQPGVVRSAGVLKYDAPVGLNDQITVSVNGGSLVLDDPAANLIVGTGCTLVNPHQARCSATNVHSMVIRALDGNDTITNDTGLAGQL